MDNQDFIDWVVDNYIYDIPYFDDWLDIALNESNSREREQLESYYELYNQKKGGE